MCKPKISHMFIYLFCKYTKGKINIKYIYIYKNKKETNSFNVNTNIKYMLIYYINIYKVKNIFLVIIYVTSWKIVMKAKIK